MSILSISDLPSAQDIGDAELSSIRGGCGLCSLGWGLPKVFGEQPKLSFDAAQSMSQSQGTTVNNGNNAAFVGMPSPVAAPATLVNTIAY